MSNRREEAPVVGGQAVIEGVMMRAPRALAVALRRPDGGLTVRDEAWAPLLAGTSIARRPFVRGAVAVIESMRTGLSALSFAAEEAERGVGAVSGILVALAGVGAEPPGGSAERSRPGYGPVVMSLLFAVTLFVALPHGLAWLVGRWLGIGEDALPFHLLDGAFKLGLFVGYVRLIGRIPEVDRVFRYHGAEHKVVNAFERGRPLELAEVRVQGTFHARCGTSFVLFVLAFSVVVFAAVLPLLPPLTEHPLLAPLASIGIKIPLMIPVAGIAYEVNRFAARCPNLRPVQLLVLPGRWMQRLTTREPDDSMLEVALAAMKAALARDEAPPSTEVRVERFPDLAAVEAALAPRTREAP